MALEFITGANKWDIDFVGKEDTTMPLEWSDETEYILNN
jgi:hypothetical protein